MGCESEQLQEKKHYLQRQSRIMIARPSQATDVEPIAADDAAEHAVHSQDQVVPRAVVAGSCSAHQLGEVERTAAHSDTVPVPAGALRDRLPLRM